MCEQNLKGGITMILFLCFMIALNVSYLYEIYFVDDFWWDEDYADFIISINCLCAIVCLVITIIGG